MLNYCSLSVWGPFPSSMQSSFIVLYVNSGCASCWFISIFRTCTSAPAALLQFLNDMCSLSSHHQIHPPFGFCVHQCIDLQYTQFCHYVPITSFFLPSSLHPVKHSFTNYNVPPRLSSFLSCISAPLRPVLLRLSLVTQAVGTCAPSWTAPCRMSVTCIYWWRRRRSRLCGEPSWKKGGATVHLLTCCSLWWWGTLTLNNKIFCFAAI